MTLHDREASSFLESLDAVTDVMQLGAALANGAQRLIGASSMCFLPFGKSVTSAASATVFHEQHSREHMLDRVVSEFPLQEHELSRAGVSATQRIFALRRPVVDLNAMFRSDGLERTRCYNEFWRPCHVERQLFAPLSSDQRALGFLCVSRTATEREFGEPELERADWLGQQAARALERLGRDDDDSTNVLEALRHLPCASALFDVSGRLLWLSAEAERLLGVRLWGIGRFWSEVDAPQLLEWQRAAVRVPGADSRSLRDGELLVQRLSGGRGPLLLVTRSVRTARRVEAPGDWKLTARESEVLLEIGAGRSNKEIAASLGRSVRTVEVHVTSLLRKSGCGSRTELLARLWG